MSQSRKMSALEAAAGVGIGYGINLAGQIVIYPLFGIHVGLAANLGISIVFTVLSLARTYTLRRIFNLLHRNVSRAAALPRFVIRWMQDGAMRLYTDTHDLDVLSIDERVPDDRVFRFGPSVQRLAPREMSDLIGDGPVYILGDKPGLEQAVRALLARRVRERPQFGIVEGDRP